MTWLGVACVVVGVAWLLWPSSLTVIQPADGRSRLFECYMLLADHVSSVGSEEQKQCLEKVLPAVAIAKKNEQQPK